MSVCSYCGSSDAPTVPTEFVSNDASIDVTQRVTCRRCLFAAAWKIQDNTERYGCVACLAMVNSMLATLIAFDRWVGEGRAFMVSFPPVVADHAPGCPLGS